MLIAGLIWNAVEDTFNTKIPKVYFAKKVKGNMHGIKTFKGKTLKEICCGCVEYLWCEHVGQPGSCPLQSNTTEEEDCEDNVRKHGGEVDNFSRGGDTLDIISL